MKIFIVSQYFYPEEFRINDIASLLVKAGHEVTVYTSLPDYKTGYVPKEFKGLKNRKTTYNGVKVVRCFSTSRRSGVLFRALNYVSFLVSSSVKAFFSKDKYDIVMCYQTSPVLMANAARVMARKRKLPFFLYCLDLWPECLKAWNVKESSPLFKIMHRYSTGIYNSADMIAVSSKAFIQYNHEVNKVPLDKFLYLPQHADDINLPPKVRKSQDEPVVFAFGGNIGSVQNIDCIIKAVNELRELENFSVEVYGEGSYLEECKKLAKQLQVEDKIHFHGRVDKKQLWKEYEKADVFLLTLKAQGAIGWTVPAKFQEYMSANRPIISSAESTSKIIEEVKCGVYVEPDNHIALANAMREFIENKGTLEGASQRARKYFLENYTKEIFLERISEAFSKLTSEK